MHEADLQVGVAAGQQIDEINLLAADDFRQLLSIFLRQHRQIVVRQLVAEDVGTVAGAQNTDADRRGRDDFTVKLLVLLQPVRVLLRRQEHSTLKQPGKREKNNRAHQIKQDGVDHQQLQTVDQYIGRHRIDDAQVGRMQRFLQHQLFITVDVAEPGFVVGKIVQ